MHILNTRPKESSDSLTKQLEHLGHQVMSEPLIQILPLNRTEVHHSLTPFFDNVITTSQQAIRCLANLIEARDFNLWCVGLESAKVAKEAGFTHVHTADGSGEDLLKKFLQTIRKPIENPIIHLSGDVIRVDIVQALINNGLPARRVIVYKTEEAESLSPDVQNALKKGKIDTVLFYSPRTAHIFEKLCKAAKIDHCCTNLSAVCLSEAIKNELLDLPWKNINIAKKATTDDLLNAMIMAD
jgi:uroporphyrinogen-III synthase